MTDRRTWLKVLAAAPLAAAVPASAVRAEAAAAGLISTSVCTLYPEVTEGPYYIDPKLVRADIRDSRPGVPLTTRIQVVTLHCTPVKDARVDIWHCDATGNYSGFAGQGSDTASDTQALSFLRGTQMTDAAGQVSFQTIYPGWYKGRTTHIHFKVFLADATVLTGQIFFPDALSQYIYDNAPAYSNRTGARDTVNANDWIARQSGDGAYAFIREQPESYDAAIVVGIDPEARSVQKAPPAPGAGPSGAGTDGQPGSPPPGPPPGGDTGPAALGKALIPGA